MRNGWGTKALGDIAQVSAGNSAPQDGALFKNGIYPFFRTADAGQIRFGAIYRATDYLNEDGVKGLKRFPKGTILFPKSGASTFLNHRVMLGVDGYVSSHLATIVADEAQIDPRFLLNFLATVEAQDLVQDHAYPSLNLPTIAGISIRVPSLSVQRRIVGILDEAFDGIAIAKANAERNLQSARALFESLLNIAIQGKLHLQNSGDGVATELISQIEKARNVAINQGKAKPKKTDPAENIKDRVKLPNNWKWSQLESLTVGISDGVHKKPQYASKGIPFITVKNLTAGPGISFDDVNYITRDDHNEFIKRTHPEKGDILITKDGTIGVVRLIETQVEFSIFVSVALIKPVMRELGPYLVYALRASCVQSQIVPQGAALKHLYLVDLRRLAIPLPPLPEQKRIVATLDSLSAETQRLESIYQQKLAALDALKKSLLHQAFSGKL